MKKILKKIVLTFFLLANLFAFSIPRASAGMESFLLGNPLGLKDELMNSMGINQAEVKNAIQTMNVLRQKVTPPQVALVFSPTNPVPGEQVTVTAAPTYFLNNAKNQYFTWYLKNKKCTDRATDKDKYTYNKDCDLDDNGKVDINDYKIKAARIISGNDFVWDTPSTLYDSDSDDDGYQAFRGGDDQKGKNTHCFFHDVPSGNDYELDGCDSTETGHLFPKTGIDGMIVGDGSFGKNEEKFWHTNPHSRDTAGTGNPDEANVAGLGMNNFTFNYSTGDKIGVVIEGIATQPTQAADSSFKIMWAFSKNTCTADRLDNDPTGTDYPKVSTAGPTTYANMNDTVPAQNYTTKKTITTTQAIVADTQINDRATIRTTTSTITVITYTDPITQAVTTISDNTNNPTLTSTCPPANYEGDPPHTLNGATCSGLDQDNQTVLHDSAKVTVQSLNNCLYDNLVTPSEGGGANQKMDVAITYSPQNPINDASDLGNGDQLSFKATVTNAQNPDYLNYEWQVFSGDAPDTESWKQLLKTDLPSATQTIGLGIDSFKFKLNFTKDIPAYLKVKLIVKDNISDTETKEGHTDVVIPISSASQRIKIYPTTVNFDDKGNPIVNIPDNSKERCLFKLKPSDPDKPTDPPTAICEVNKNEILGLKIDNSDNTYANFLWTIDGKTLTCPNANFQNCLSQDDKQTQTNTSYLPILKEVDDQFTINLSATGTGANAGKQLSLSRAFKVVNPSVKIVPNEHTNLADQSQYTCRGTLLGQYIDLDGRAWDDRSETEFQALTGNTIELTPTFSGADLSRDTDRKKFQWTVDGNTISEANVVEYGGYGIKDGTLILPPKAYGESYAIAFSTLYTQDAAVKKALNAFWNVSYGDFYEKKLTHAIKIQMASVELAKAKTGKQPILATISAGIPSYIAFLFRIVLSGLVIIFATKILFFILPKTKNYYEY